MWCGAYKGTYIWCETCMHKLWFTSGFTHLICSVELSTYRLVLRIISWYLTNKNGIFVNKPLPGLSTFFHYDLWGKIKAYVRDGIQVRTSANVCLQGQCGKGYGQILEQFLICGFENHLRKPTQNLLISFSSVKKPFYKTSSPDNFLYSHN